MSRKVPTELSDDLDEAIGFLIADTSREIRRSLYARIAQHGVRGGSWYLLRVLWQQDGVSQRDLAVRLGLSGPSVQEMLTAMEQDGLVLRERDPLDRRKIRVLLSAKARKLRKPLMALAEEVNAIALAGLGAEQQQQLKDLLKDMKARLAADAAQREVQLDLRTEAGE
jgi:DNA-binding MarR family transcriptional regulator